MAAPNELAWYKWFPVKAMTSTRWATLTLEEEGFYRRLYDLASVGQPASRRGYLYEHDRPIAPAHLWHMLRIHHSKGRALLKHLADKGLVDRDQNGAWGFPNFAKHQRSTPLRQRATDHDRRKNGTESAQNWQEPGAELDRAHARVRQDADADVQKQKREEEEGAPPRLFKDALPEAPSTTVVPPELAGLQLYRLDKKLHAAWPSLVRAVTTAYPDIDLVTEMRKAHAWEVANPSKRKKERARFLNNWFKKAQQDQTEAGAAEEQDPNDPYLTDFERKVGFDGGLNRESGFD